MKFEMEDHDCFWIVWPCIAAVLCCLVISVGHHLTKQDQYNRDTLIHREAIGAGTQQETVTQTRKVERL